MRRKNGQPWDGENEEMRQVFDEALRELTEAAAALSRQAVTELYEMLAAQASEPEPEPAAVQWGRLKSRTAEELIYLVDNRPELRSRDLAVLMAAESVAAAQEDPERALVVARAAHRLALQVARAEGESGALPGWIQAHLANVERVADTPEVAGGTMAAALRSWRAASEADRARLPGWRLADLEGSLRRDQGDHPGALACLSEARAAAPPEAVAGVLVNRAITLVHMEDPGGALALLEEAEAAAQAAKPGDPRLILAIHHNRCAALVDLGRHEEAERHWPAAQAAADPRKVFDAILLVWLRARIEAGLGKLAQSREGFNHARREYDTHKMAANYAVVSLERAVLDLKEGRYAAVKELAEEMNWIFKAKGLHTEALAALKLFCTAAERETLTVDVAERMVRYLYRAQYDPELKFAG